MKYHKFDRKNDEKKSKYKPNLKNIEYNLYLSG